MSVEQALDILAGVACMPEDCTVESVFQDAHIVPHPVTPF